MLYVCVCICCGCACAVIGATGSWYDVAAAFGAGACTGRGAGAGAGGRATDAGNGGELCEDFGALAFPTAGCAVSCPPGTRKVNEDVPAAEPLAGVEVPAWLPLIFSLILLGLEYSERASGVGRSDISWRK